MIIDNGRRAKLVIAGVIDGMCGVQGNEISFIPNRPGSKPESVKGGMLDGKPVLLRTSKAESGPFYIASFEELS